MPGLGDRIRTAGEQLSAGPSAIPGWMTTVGIASWLIVGMAGVIALTGWFFTVSASITIPLIIAAVIGMIAYPLCERMIAHKVPKSVAALIVILLLMVVARRRGLDRLRRRDLSDAEHPGPDTGGNRDADRRSQGAGHRCKIGQCGPDEQAKRLRNQPPRAAASCPRSPPPSRRACPASSRRRSACSSRSCCSTTCCPTTPP